MFFKFLSSFFRKYRRRNIIRDSIDPDEILIDSSNLPQFDVHQFEGRFEKQISSKVFLLIILVTLIILISFVSKLWVLQISKGEIYASQSEQNRLRQNMVFADRGVIYDRNGKPLVWNDPNPETTDYSLRTYTTETGLSHVLGYIAYPKKDESGFYYREELFGVSGVEKTYNQKLSGENGLKIVETNALSEIISESVINKPENGQSLTLSIDADLQHALFEIISKTAQEVGFEGGTGILMDVENGDVLALTSYPEFSSQVLTNGEDQEKIDEYKSNPQNLFLNRAVSGLYTPGSIIKPFVAWAVLEEEVISPEKEILSTGSISIPNPYFPDQETVFNDWKAHGWVDIYDALAVSSNVYFFETVGGYEDQKGIGIDTFKKYMKLFGLGEKTGIPLSSESDGTVPSPEWKKENFDGEVWRIGDTYNTAIGQYGFQITPIQAARAVSTVANGGELIQPKLLLEEPKVVTKILTTPGASKNFKVVRKGMRQAVLEGTAKGLNVPYVSVAAKTGTAELGSRKKKVNSWVIGFFPYEKPKYSFVVTMEKGGRENLIGGVYVMSQLLDWIKINRPEYLEIK